MEGWDLVVAGAGPAGCALAAKVAGAGWRVLLLEREQEPGAGRDWVVDVGPGTFAEARVPEPRPEELFSEPGRTLLVTSDGECTVDLLPAPLVPVRNAPYVRRLAGWASDSGAELRTRSTASGLLLHRGAAAGVVVSSGGGESRVEARMVADCTGIAGALRRQTPASWLMSEAIRAEDTVLARRETRLVDVPLAQGEVNAGRMIDGVRLDRIASQGVYSVETCYADLAKGFIDVLIGVKPGSGPTADERFDAFFAGRPCVTEKVFGDGGPIPIRRTLAGLVGDGMLVLGDSACQVIPAHGSGTASALLAAEMASRSVLRALETGRRDRQVLWGYAHAFQSGRGAVLAYYDVIRRYTETLQPSDVDALVANGLLGPLDVYRGLIPEVPRLSARELLARAPAALRVPGLLAGIARAGSLAGRVRAHYMAYPTAYRPGELEAWAERMPDRVRSAG